ncbi:hypothetical protein PLICRDRAFT_59757, partial [Plicaturopsis crispa FD-325 SS-3]
ELSAALRVEWAKAKARAEQWHEEVILLKEEMCRVLAFCDWKASWWESQADRRTDVSPELAESLGAYCAENASKERRMRASLERKWCGIRAWAREV